MPKRIKQTIAGVLRAYILKFAFKGGISEDRRQSFCLFSDFAPGHLPTHKGAGMVQADG